MIDNEKFALVKNLAILLQACNTQLSKSKKNKLMNFNFGKNSFKNSPAWVMNWAYFCSKAIKEEQKTLLNSLK